MAKKTETKVENVERIYIIPIREKTRNVPRYRKTEKAVKTIKEFLVRHMKIRDRDLKKIKIDNYLNEYLWMRGIKNPPHKVRVKATKEGEIVKVELVDYPTGLKFKKAREERLESAAAEVGKKKKEQKVEVEKSEEEKKAEEEKKVEEKEKIESTIEAGKEMEKAAAKQMKHQAPAKTKGPKRPMRKALAK